MSSQSVSQGTIYLIFANLSFLISGYIINIGLGRIFGPESYGMYAVIIAIVTMFNLIFTTGIPQAVSKYTSEDPGHQKNVLKAGLVLSVCFSIAAYLIIVLESPAIALVLHDPSLTLYLQVVSVMIVTYGPLYVIAAYFNGIQDYRIQSYLNILYNVLKPALIFTFVLMGFSLWGAIMGFVLSPIIPLYIGILSIGLSTIVSTENFPIKKILAFSIPIVILSVSTNLILSLDLFFIKGTLMNNQITGLYSAASQIARIPYFIMLGISAALFPAISSCMENRDKIQNYIRESVRYTLILIIPVAMVISVSSIPLISLIFSDDFAAGGQPLEVLIFGICFLGLFSLFLTIISGCNQPYLALFLTLFVLIIDFVANSILVPVAGMSGGALATTISGAAGAGICSVYLYRKYGSFIGGVSLMKILFSAAVAAFLVKYLNFTDYFLIIGYFAAFFVYLTMLYLLQEIHSHDIRRFMDVFR